MTASRVDSSLQDRAIGVLPIGEVLQPQTPEDVVQSMRDCAAGGTPVYPIGGGTSLTFGLPPQQQGVGLSLAKLGQIIDYPARDMTITVEAGLPMQRLADTLAEEGQRLPIDVPFSQNATLGGVVATNWNGCLRYGQGSVRDHVIGIQAVDGRGSSFRGGGRVVKNVAGYDFCKLLTGSLGTLAVITELTMKLKPIPESTALVVGELPSLETTERLLGELNRSRTTPAAVELLGGPAWQTDPVWQQLGASETGCLLAVWLEGTAAEVEWMVPTLEAEWKRLGAKVAIVVRDEDARSWMRPCTEFPGQDAPLVIKMSVVPSHTTHLIAAAQRVDPSCSYQAHAGNGIVHVCLSEVPASGLAKSVVGQLQPAAAAGHGSLVILSNPTGIEQTRQSVWGHRSAAVDLMSRVKQQFDPHNLLNPGRFVFDG